MDRNKNTPQNKVTNMRNVALRKESVDRNRYLGIKTDPLDWSLSARRAWIEIVHRGPYHFYLGRSLSARRAWIEMNVGFPIAAFLLSLSARRAWIEMALYWFSIADR